MHSSINERLNQVKVDSVSKRLEPHMDDIEHHIKRGVPHQTVVDILNEEGYEMTLNSFRSMLYRYRQCQKKADETTPQTKKPENKKDKEPATTTAGKNTPSPKTAAQAEDEYALQFDEDGNVIDPTIEKQRKLEQLLRNRNKPHQASSNYVDPVIEKIRRNQEERKKAQSQQKEQDT